MCVDVLDANKLCFILFAEKFGDKVPLPLRRTLSLIRSYGCQTIVCEERKWQDSCSQEECGLRFTSCQDYISNLHFYGQTFKEKLCWRISFFKTKFDKKEDIKFQNNKDCMGYCIIQKDKIKTSDDKIWDRTYLTESLIKEPFKNADAVFGQCQTSVKIEGQEFSTNHNYFSQQNGITNCCAHAAIKMAVRAYCCNITCEKINDVVKINHRDRKGRKGLDGKEICTAIKTISGLETDLLCPGNDFSSLEFLKTIYFAIESRFPVILLFRIPGEKNDTGHAVTLIGHTFNRDNWWPYGLGYFESVDKNIKYLPSLLWCDNFIVQDDNFGPYYLMPTRFLTDPASLSEIFSSISRVFSYTASPLSIRKPWLQVPIFAFIVYPPDKPVIKDVLLVEELGIATLNNYISSLSDDELPSNLFFKKYFHVYQKLNTLILRSFAVSKEEYLASSGVEVIPNELTVLIESLPDTFWITEISIPELFWINTAKVGEIITDPELFNKQHKHEKDAVVFVRLPNRVIFFDENSTISFDFEQAEPHHQLISAKGLL